MIRRILITLGILAAPLIVGLLFTYEAIGVEFYSFMERQPFVGYQEGPRRLPPEGALTFAGDVRVEDVGVVRPNPVPADEVSLQRGALLYGFHCLPCHGETGVGDGPMVERWREGVTPPADLTQQRIAAQADGELFLTISYGYGAMPPLAENLTLRERWDIINHARRLQEIADGE